MWNNVAKIIQNPSTKRLALAIIVSAVMHACLVGGFNVRLPNLNKELHTIEARLQMPKMEKKTIVTQSIIKKENAQSKLVTAPVPQAQEIIPKPAQELTQEISQEISQDLLPVLEPQSTDSTPEILNVPEPEQADIPPIQATQPENNDSTQTEPQPIDTGLVINENAYQYAETDFDVRTEIDGTTEGSAKIVFNLIDSEHYQLTSLIKPQGLAALIVSNLLQTSDGQLTKTGLQPVNYLYQYGDKVDKTYAAKFDWANKTVNLTTAKGTKTQEIAEGAQDLLSFMYQFMYVAPLERMQISIATGKKFTAYDYNFSGEENINIPMGEIKTIHIFYESENADEKTELWLALDYQYLPVKIRKTEKNGKVYELAANRISTARPTLN